MNIRKNQEELENKNLSKYAAKSKNTTREFPITPCDIRTEFQRDRDRITHCKSFRRLKFKTQVFIKPEGDHYRTRLVHTLEVSQIARTIARALNLNEDLCEAMALGHDLGHTPFGHIGEIALNDLLINSGGFSHNNQSLRVVEKIENAGLGLNLTDLVRDGILNHKKDGTPKTLEGRILSYADRIAYLNHDIDDAIRAGILQEKDLPSHCIDVFGETHGKRINNMIYDIIDTSFGHNYIKMSTKFEQTLTELRNFMFEKVYFDKTAKSEEHKAKGVITSLFKYYLKNTSEISQEILAKLDRDGEKTCVTDYIACMTDRFAIKKYEDIFVPKGWTHY